jgi:hypothetical protein
MRKFVEARTGRAAVAIVVVLIIIIGIGAAIYGGGLFYTTDISRIQSDPAGWEGQEVYIKGEVTQVITFILHGFVVDDGTDQIYVDWADALPAVGDTVIVRGIARQLFTSAYIEGIEVRQAWF